MAHFKNKNSALCKNELIPLYLATNVQTDLLLDLGALQQKEINRDPLDSLTFPIHNQIQPVKHNHSQLLIGNVIDASFTDEMVIQMQQWQLIYH